MLGEDLLADLGGHGRRGRHGSAVDPHDLAAEGLLLIGYLDHVDLAVQLEVCAGHREGGAPLASACLGRHAFEALLFGVVCLGDGGVQLVAAAGVVAFKLVVDLCRGTQLLLEAVGPDQGRGPVHLVEVEDLPGDRVLAGVVVQFLLHQVFAEDAGKLLGGHGLVRAGVEQGGGLVLHVGPQVVPVSGHLVFVQVDLVGDFVLGHGAGSFLFSGQ